MAEETLCPKCNAVNPAETSFCSKCGTAIGKKSSDEMQDPFIGTFVGERFLVKRRLGEGGMGVVYEAEQTAMDRKVALKVLHPHLNDDELYVRFQREAAASSKLEHPNIITVYDFGRTENDSLYIAMEFIDGKSLDDEIKQNGAMAWDRACRIGTQICSALRNAHDKNIIHRDMKPENVMLCKRGDETDFVKVLDFGIAKMLEDGEKDQQKALTKTGMVFGTPQYMSPEQVRGEKLDARSDIYSVGIILYEMLTGTIPFKADTPMGLLTKHLIEMPPAFATANASVSVP
ncbi:MAG: protein kinase, partial [Deltaproteobacteria bacterium]|nr:protein kinase [Deltaproteobacteria bacterium]